jgi:hypothetical protein
LAEVLVNTELALDLRLDFPGCFSEAEIKKISAVGSPPPLVTYPFGLLRADKGITLLLVAPSGSTILLQGNSS